MEIEREHINERADAYESQQEEFAREATRISEEVLEAERSYREEENRWRSEELLHARQWL